MQALPTMLYDVAIGAISTGVNQSTFFALNGVVFVLWLLLAYLLYATATSEPYGWLAPHCAAMLGLCTCLAGVLNWYIVTVGLTTVEQQEASLVGADGDASGAIDDAHAMDAELAERLRNLPLQSDIDLALHDAGKFDTSTLQIQNLPSTSLLPPQPAEREKVA